jgi:hypothetical protein
MPEVDINDLTSLGVINDVKPYMLPPEAWTLGLNVRYRDKGVESLLGWERVFGTPGVAPHFLFSISTPAGVFWIYTSLTQTWLYDGTNHTNISGPALTTAETRELNGTVFSGIPIINNGTNIPQYRPNMSPATLFANLVNWPAALRARVIRSFSPYIMAFGLTDGGVLLPHTVQWSHPADPGSMPSSWDYSNPAVDAGRKDLDDVNAGIILDALPLSSAMYVYKEQSTWRAVPIGGRFIFDWKTVFETSGILTQRCVALTGDGKRHCVVTQDDMIWHNGTRVVSILDKKQRTKLFGDMDTLNYVNSFLFCNPLGNEMWLCYPTQGNIQPNKALIWNYSEGGETGVVSFADGITFRNAAIGNIQTNSDELWSDGEDLWSEDTGPWSEFTRRRVIAAGTDATRFYNLDKGNTRDGVVFAATLQRESQSVLGRGRRGEWIVDHHQLKMLQRLWPKMSGGPINIRVGAQQTVEGPITWTPAQAFDPTAIRFVDFDPPVSGAAISLEFSTDSAVSWRLEGYKLPIDVLGEY